MLHPTYEYIRHLIFKNNKKQRLSIVDYGCGNGLLIDLIGTKRIGTYHGYEISNQALKIAQAKYAQQKNIKFSRIEKGNVPKFGKKNSVDVIVLIGVLQYLNTSEIQQILVRAQHTLRRDGKIILSCAVDHQIYNFFNLYRLFLPHHYIQKARFFELCCRFGFTVSLAREKGLLIAPCTSYFIVLFFDVLDRVIWRKKGELGLLGKGIRHLSAPLIYLEYKIPINFGYTLFVVLKKS